MGRESTGLKISTVNNGSFSRDIKGTPDEGLGHNGRAELVALWEEFCFQDGCSLSFKGFLVVLPKHCS